MVLVYQFSTYNEDRSGWSESIGRWLFLCAALIRQKPRRANYSENSSNWLPIGCINTKFPWKERGDDCTYIGILFDSWWVLIRVGRFHWSLWLSRVDEFAVNHVQSGLDQISTLRIAAIAESWRALARLGWALVVGWWGVLGLFIENWSGEHALLLVLLVALCWRRFNHFLLWLVSLIPTKKLFSRLAPFLLLLLILKWIPFA